MLGTQAPGTSELVDEQVPENGSRNTKPQSHGNPQVSHIRQKSKFSERDDHLAQEDISANAPISEGEPLRKKRRVASRSHQLAKVVAGNDIKYTDKEFTPTARKCPKRSKKGGGGGSATGKILRSGNILGSSTPPQFVSVPSGSRH